MTRWTKTLTLTASMTLALGGCAYTGVAQSMISGAWPVEGGDLGARAYRAVDDMLEEAPSLARTGGPVVVASVADIADVDHSTPFGNIVADLVRTRLVQRGVSVTEMRLRSSVRLNRADGELMLGRNPRTLLAPPVAGEVITGTYAVGSSQIYVSLKIVETSGAHIVAAVDFVTPRTWNVEQLLAHTVASAR